jgi:hypothetical protein
MVLGEEAVAEGASAAVEVSVAGGGHGELCGLPVLMP